jgi:uncharacterized protein
VGAGMDEPGTPPIDESIDLLWRSTALSSLEHFSYRPGREENMLGGTVVVPRDETPTTIRYQVRVSPDWEVGSAQFTLSDPSGETRTDIANRDGRWWVDQEERPDLAACTDLDLGWTPSTNTLPIRRTSLPVGDSIDVRAAWVTFPDLVIRPAQQRYERVDGLTWIYQSGDFAAELTTDHRGLVVRYGEDIWSTVTSSNGDLAPGRAPKSA